MPSKCTVFGNLQNLAGGTVPQGTITFELANLGTGNPVYISGTTVIPQLRYIVYAAADGSFSQALWGNDNLLPANTIYNVTFRDNAGNEVGPIQYSFTGSSVNLNSAAPINNVVPPVLAAAVPVLTLLNQQGPLSAVVGTGADATLYTYSIPASTIAAGQGIRVTAYFTHTTGSASVTYKLTLGSTTLVTLTGADTNVGSSISADIFNNAAVQNAQNFSATEILGGSTDVVKTTTGTSAENLANASTIKLTFNVANTDQVTPKFWLVEIINGPATQTPSRLQVYGTALVSGDFVLTGWGTGASISSIRGCDSAHGYQITAGSGSISAGPTVQLTYHDGAWPNPPVVLADVVGGTGQQSPLVITGTASAYTFTYGGFPQPNQTFIFNVHAIGI